jgi:hypothetical protein
LFSVAFSAPDRINTSRERTSQGGHEYFFYEVVTKR